MNAQLFRGQLEKVARQAAALQGAFMLEGVPGGEQNFRWVLRLVCVLGALALHSAHSVASPSAEKGRQGCRVHGAQLSHHTYLRAVREAVRATWPQRESMNPPPYPDPCCSEHEYPPSPASRSQGPWPVSPCLGLETGNPGPRRALVHTCVCVRERQAASGNT